MSNYIRLKTNYSADYYENEAGLRYDLVIHNYYWGKAELAVTYTAQELYNVPTTTHEDSPNPERYPSYLDQWTDPVTGVMWTTWANGKQTGFNPAAPIELNELDSIFKVPSMKCELAYPYVFSDPTSAGAADGVIKVRAMGGNSNNYTFTLTGGLGSPFINTTGVFTGLTQGSYTISISQTSASAQPDVATGQFPDFLSLTDEVARTPRYVGAFTDMLKNPISVEIYRKGYEGVAEEICLSGTPITITTDILGDDFLAGLIPTDIQVNLIQEYDGQYDDIFLNDKEMWTVRINGGNIQGMEGLIMIGETAIEYQDNPIHIQLTATGGLTDMGTVKIEGWSGIISLIDAIAAIQNNYNVLQFQFKELVGMYEENDPASYGIQTLSRYKVNAAMFNGSTPKDVVNDICESFGASLTQTNDNYLYFSMPINLSKMIDTTITGQQYTQTGIPTTQPIFQTDVIDVNCNREGDAFYVDRNQSFGYLPKVTKFTITVAFEELDEWKMSTDVNDWYNMRVNQGSSSLQEGTDGVMILTGVAEGTLYTLLDRPKCSYGSFDVYGNKINISSAVDFMIKNPVSNEQEQLVREICGVMVILGAEHCMTTSPNDDLEMDLNLGELQSFQPSKSDTWSTLKMNNTTSNPDPPTEGMQPLRLWINGLWRQSQSNHENQTVWPTELHFKEGTLQANLPVNDEELNVPFEYDVGLDGEDIGDIKLAIGNSPSYSDYSLNHGGVLARENYVNAINFISVFNENPVPFREQIASSITILRGKDLKRLEGTLYTNYPNINSIIYDRMLEGGFFIPQHFTYDVKFNKLEFSSLEATSSTGDRLLETDDNLLLESGDKRQLQ